jgi:hypothetical protein
MLEKMVANTPSSVEARKLRRIASFSSGGGGSIDNASETVGATNSVFSWLAVSGCKAVRD